jgi:hypothetical protein
LLENKIFKQKIEKCVSLEFFFFHAPFAEENEKLNFISFVEGKMVFMNIKMSIKAHCG